MMPPASPCPPPTVPTNLCESLPPLPVAPKIDGQVDCGLPLRDLVAQVLARGGEINVCTPCMAKRGLHKEDMIAGVSFVDGLGFVRVVAETERTIQL